MAETSRFVLGDHHFGRFTRSPAENDAAVLAAETAHASAAPGQSEVDAAVDLGEALTIAGREAQALGLLLPAVHEARATGDRQSLGWALMVLATAEHYADRLGAAEGHFAEALDLAKQIPDEVLEHYALHHLARLLVDTQRTAEAVAAFTTCLGIRERLGEPKAAGTRAALDALTTDV